MSLRVATGARRFTTPEASVEQIRTELVRMRLVRSGGRREVRRVPLRPVAGVRDAA